MSRAAVYQGVRVTGPLKFVEIVENTLGWVPPGDPMRGRHRHAAVLKRKIATDPQLYTWPNLLLALEYARRQQLDLRSPAGLCGLVERALKAAAIPVLDDDIEGAIEVELMQQRPHWREWVRRLDRARGESRVATYREWQAARAA